MLALTTNQKDKLACKQSDGKLVTRKQFDNMATETDRISGPNIQAKELFTTCCLSGL